MIDSFSGARRAIPVLAIGLALLAGACASDEGPPARRGGPGREPFTPLATLFISPSGQPFRSAPGQPYPVAAWFAQADRNGDGKIDRAEFRADAEAFFKTLDKNGDGVLDGFEIAAYEHDVAPEILGAYRAGGHSGPGHRRGPGGENAGGAEVMGGGTPYELLSDPEPVAAADLSLSGRVTLADFLAAADRRFDLLDTRKQGYLVLAELPKTPIQRAAEEAARKHHKTGR
jgi:hypothetical protein